MLKLVLLSSLLLLTTTTSFADLYLSEKIRPKIKSLLNTEIERLPIPATLNNMILPEFGKGIIGWGAGPKDAEARFQTINKVDVEKIKQHGVTLAMAQAWRNFYENETLRNPGNPTAPFRAQLMKKIASLW
ncbi:DUF4951 domain-containing protein [Acinetobacter lwoffii]|uniref:DUF4951 domain-containing protein n=1 Tax=Acinetobacter lwoffii TaxID=28090 RepID=A0AAW8B000_ACILW|nr:DUF4951 domain-containing protein [Acinetobacter lwoffii]MCO8079798.1 DUF4951 domain-containing protein [Acinetobacter lwoffii]MDP1372048.1 DUF4951 domain-containing protein [Acinetobacter lwoffii]MDP1391450.1 DUF4951 domain-containing protein [Acinetobacter lwoffii]MDP1449152.1 DUF4951 domain-containing protein [Acinetobacter lwoffii]MRA04707.1 DUF4951 domain-containing protein [Acinetobacter lwoffii]